MLGVYNAKLNGRLLCESDLAEKLCLTAKAVNRQMKLLNASANTDNADEGKTRSCQNSRKVDHISKQTRNSKETFSNDTDDEFQIGTATHVNNRSNSISADGMDC